MPQHDYVISNASGATVRADINTMALAISSTNSGSSSPSTTYAFQLWMDTSNNVLKLRNAANNAWITLPLSTQANNTVDINGGAIDGTPIGANSASTGAFTTLNASGVVSAASLDISGAIDVDGTTNLDVVDIDGAVDMASTLTVAGVLTGSSLDISGDIDVDGTTNLDVVDIDGAVDMASTLTVAGVLTGASLDISGDIDVDGTTNLDVVDIDGAVDMASTLAVGGTATFTGLVDAAIIDGVNFKINGGQGSDGQVLTSTGSGVAWEGAGGGLTFKAFGTNSIMVGDDGTGTISGADNNTALGLGVIAALTSGDNNTAVGFDALKSVTTGEANVAVGKDAGKSIIDASNNVVLGKNSGSSINTGSTNICIGVDTGGSLSSGNNNILLGNTARPSASGGANQIAMGLVATCVGDNNFTFGNQSTDSNIAFGATSITAPSDIRLKEDIQDETVGLDFLNDLRPVTFIWKKEKDIPTEMKAYKQDSETRTMNGKYNHGFIAQEVKASIEKYGLKEGFDMWQADEADGRQRVAPAAAVPLMIKAIQELSAKVDELQEQINSKE